tara:strand:- start:407 stop:544 length:138 start_codon:yes stop_codon:yes gene_type:complete
MPVCLGLLFQILGPPRFTNWIYYGIPKNIFAFCKAYEHFLLKEAE